MGLLRSTFLVIFFIFSPLLSEEHPSETTGTQANLFGLPNAVIAGKVNAITGEFVEHDVDFSLSAPNPLLFERSYSSSFGVNGTLALGWNLNHLTDLFLYDIKKSYKIYVNEGQGAFTKFSGKFPIDRRIFVSESCIENGVTNCSKGEISGKTNLKNVCFYSEIPTKNLYPEINKYSIFEGDGTRHIYFPNPHTPIGEDEHEQAWVFHPVLLKTIYPNGNILRYYREKDVINCELVSPKNDSLAKFKYLYFSNKTKVVLPNQHEITYRFKELHGHKCLVYVERPESPPIGFAYKMDEQDEHPRITKTEFPNQRRVEIEYWGLSSKHRKGKRFNRVKALREPVGETAELIQTYTFDYHLHKSKKNGITTVKDVNGCKTKYVYDGSQRLTEIKQFGSQPSFYRQDSFEWGKDQDLGNLIKHTVSDGAGQTLTEHSYIYDKQGNPLSEKISGNLTGEGFGTHEKTCTFSNNAYNLKISEKLGDTKTLYSYFPGSDKVKTMFICDKDVIKERHFYEYNKYNILIKEIIDDGSGNDLEDWTGITQRLIHLMNDNDTAPFYLPKEEKIIYVDKSGQEFCAKHIFNHYDVHEKLVAQDYFDQNNKHRYSLHWDYDKYGNVIREVNALAEETIRKYDNNHNLIYEQGPNKAYHTVLYYDYMDRLTKVVKVDNKSLEEFTITHKYDKKSNRIATIDEYNNETNFEYDDFNRLVKTIAPPVTDPFGANFRAEQVIHYDTLNFPIITIDGDQKSTHQLNTIRGQPYYISYPDGTQERMLYNLDGTLKEKTEKNGAYTRYTYDYKNRPISAETYMICAIELLKQELKMPKEMFYGRRHIPMMPMAIKQKSTSTQKAI